MPRKLTPTIIHAASTDAGNRSMRAGGRKTWSLDDRNAAVAESERLYRIFDRTLVLAVPTPSTRDN